MLCNKTVAVDHSGIGQVNQHAGSGSHSLKSNTCFFFRPTKIWEDWKQHYIFAVNHCKQNVFGHWKLPNKTEIFTLVMISTHFSMFLCEVSEFSVGHTKMSYIVWHGLSEVLLNELVDDIKASIGTFTFWMK